MLSVSIEQTGDDLSLWERHLHNIDRVFGTNRPVVREMADILEFEHKDSFDRGFRDPDYPWEPTHPIWAERMEGKPGVKPLVWKGEAEKSISARVKGDSVEVRGADYLGKFQFGPKESAVPIKAGGNVAYPGERVVFYEPITVKHRHIFDVLPRDVEQLMFNLGERVGGMEFSGGSRAFR